MAPNGAVRLLEAGGERAEAELIGAALLELVEAGAPPGDMAVLVRSAEEAPLLAQTLEAYGLPVDRTERLRVRDTRLGAGPAGLRRGGLRRQRGRPAALAAHAGEGRAHETVDGLERRLRRAGVAGAADADRMLEEPSVTEALAALRAAAEEGAEAFLDALEAELDAIWTAPHLRQAAVLDADGLEDARVAGEIRYAAGELRQLAAADAALVGGPADILATLGAVEVRTGGGRRSAASCSPTR